MKKGILPNINPLYQYSNKKMPEYRAYLNWQENIKKEKGWKNFSNAKRLNNKVEPLKKEPYKNPKPYQLRGYNREEEQKFQEINKENLKHYNENLAEKQTAKLSKLSKFYREATQRIKLPIIPNRFNIRPKPDYAEERKREYEQALLFVDKKQSKENCEDFNYNIENVEDINYNIKNVKDFNSNRRIENANYKYLKKFKSNKKKCWQIEYEKQNRQVKQAKELLSKLEEKDIDTYLDSM